MDVYLFLLAVAYGILFILFVSCGVRMGHWIGCHIGDVVPSRYKPVHQAEHDRIQILVLGDIGRSPRMQYHGISVMKHGRKVDLVGYKESARHPSLIGNQNVALYPLSPVPTWIEMSNSLLIRWPLKAVQQFWTVFHTLMYATPPARWIILQNPPSIPTFHVALLVSAVRGSKVLVDWHNYGHTLIRQSAKGRAVAPLYRWYETFFGRWLGSAHLAVTDAMARQLKETPFGITTPVHTLHDRPAEIFQPIFSAQARKKFLLRLPETRGDAQDVVDGAVRLVVSSTSWTKDEDFGMLLDALVAYAAPSASRESDHDPPSPILAVITGRGPEQAAYMAKVRELREANRIPGIRILTAWLSNRDYAGLLACADLGISLHKSSSGVDLPMKVVDMFGAGLPVAAYSAFESFGELVKEGVNGCGFETAEQLTEILRRLLGMGGEEELAQLKRGAVKEGGRRWHEEWDRVVAPVLELERDGERGME